LNWFEDRIEDHNFPKIELEIQILLIQIVAEKEGGKKKSRIWKTPQAFHPSVRIRKKPRGVWEEVFAN
jgi:hypothetical protein